MAHKGHMHLFFKYNYLGHLYRIIPIANNNGTCYDYTNAFPDSGTLSLDLPPICLHQFN